MIQTEVPLGTYSTTDNVSLINSGDVTGFTIQIEELEKQRDALADNLNIIGIEASKKETLNSLIPKVLQISKGSGEKAVLFEYGDQVVNKFGDSIFTIFQDGIRDINSFIRDNRPFCSPSENYALSYTQENFSWDGLAKKVCVLILIIVAVRVDVLLGTSYVRDAVCIAFCTNELISIVANAGTMGVQLPAVLINALELLKKKSGLGIDCLFTRTH